MRVREEGVSMENKDWTTTQHDSELHQGRALSQTGMIENCPRCKQLENNENQNSYKPFQQCVPNELARLMEAFAVAVGFMEGIEPSLETTKYCRAELERVLKKIEENPNENNSRHVR